MSTSRETLCIFDNQDVYKSFLSLRLNPPLSAFPSSWGKGCISVINARYLLQKYGRFIQKHPVYVKT